MNLGLIFFGIKIKYDKKIIKFNFEFFYFIRMGMLLVLVLNRKKVLVIVEIIFLGRVNKK